MLLYMYDRGHVAEAIQRAEPSIGRVNVGSGTTLCSKRLRYMSFPTAAYENMNNSRNDVPNTGCGSVSIYSSTLAMVLLY